VFVRLLQEVKVDGVAALLGLLDEAAGRQHLVLGVRTGSPAVPAGTGCMATEDLTR